ncbi:MAG TPA: LirA/MavJ family T4SS effector [Acidiferrobacter sp.]|nr:LirA/MavJ family T4SS effector [Acidiferrobacter sp.]
MATYESMLKEFEDQVYKDKWATPAGPKLPAPKDAKYIHDLAKIGAFLNPENAEFCRALEIIDEEMINLFNKRSKDTFKKSKITLKSFSNFEHGRSGDGTKDTKHLLTEVLAAREIGEGFQGVDERGRGVSFYNNLDSDEFGGAIRSMHLAKDYVGTDHGAYTHRIQWYCASVMKTAIGLKNEKTSATFKSSGRVWGLVFDRNAREGVPLERNDFRRPELMNPWIAANARYGNYAWPVLSAFIKSRMDRMSSRGWSSDVLRINAAAKLFPDKVKPSLGYRKAAAIDNELELASFKLSSEEFAQIEKLAGGYSLDRVRESGSALVSFKGGVKNYG